MKKDISIKVSLITTFIAIAVAIMLFFYPLVLRIIVGVVLIAWALQIIYLFILDWIYSKKKKDDILSTLKV